MNKLLGACFTIICLCLLPGTTLFAADWPQFRGPNRDGISTETGLLRQWPEGGPEVLWTVEVGPGYAAAAIVEGHVYFNDYDKPASEWRVRRLTLADGKETWRYQLPADAELVDVPAVGPSGSLYLRSAAWLHVVSNQGELRWRMSISKQSLK